MMGRKIAIIVLAGMLLAAMTAPALMATATPRATATPAPTAKPGNNILSVLQSRPEFSTMAGDIKNADLQDTLSGNGPYTVFAPTNDAFGRVPAATMNNVNSNKMTIAYVMNFHIVSGKYSMDDLKRMTYLNTLNGRPVPVKWTGNQLYVDGARVTGEGIDTGNGIVYPVDAVMIPPMLTA